MKMKKIQMMIGLILKRIKKSLLKRKKVVLKMKKIQMMMGLIIKRKKN